MAGDGSHCPGGCGTETNHGRWAHGHKHTKCGGKAGANGAAANGASGNSDLMLKVEADEELCESMFKRLTLRQKVAALNSLDR